MKSIHQICAGLYFLFFTLITSVNAANPAPLSDVYNGERVFSKSIINILRNVNIRDDNDENTQVTISKREQEILNLLL